jgi:hypothetical protein
LCCRSSFCLFSRRYRPMRSIRSLWSSA